MGLCRIGSVDCTSARAGFIPFSDVGLHQEITRTNTSFDLHGIWGKSDSLETVLTNGHGDIPLDGFTLYGWFFTS